MPTKMTFLLSDEVREALQRMAREQRRSMTGVVEYLIVNPGEASDRQVEIAYEKGYTKGYEKGHEDAYDKGYEAAEEKAAEDYDEKLTATYEQWLESDEVEGKLRAAYERGYEDGREKGHNEE